MALVNKSVTFTASSATCPVITMIRQPDGTFVATGHIQVNLSDGQVMRGEATLSLTTTAQQNATTALENALLRVFRLARGLET